VGSGGKLGFTTRADGAMDGAALDGEVVGPNVVGATDGASVKGYAVSNTAMFFKFPTNKYPFASATQPR
jgi:hypothetical protein